MRPIAALIATMALATPALAGGPIVVEQEPMIAPVMETVVAQSMDWSGIYAGAQLGYADIDSNGAGFNGYGGFGGIHAGYRYDFGKFVAGAELAYDGGSIDLGSVNGDTVDDMISLKLTGGAEFGRSLFYGAIGAAQASATIGGSDLSDNGFFYGAGMDYAVSDRWTVGGELMQHNFDDFDGTGVDIDSTTAKVKIAMRF